VTPLIFENFGAALKLLNYIRKKMTEEVRRGYKIEIYDQPPSNNLDEFSPRLNANPGRSEPTEALRIDDKNIPYQKTNQGYRIYYQPPEDSLIDAARSFIDTQREKSE